jgi:hypothetical protein
MSCSIMGIFISSSYVIVIGWSTMPWIRSCQVDAESCGVTREVSTR